MHPVRIAAAAAAVFLAACSQVPLVPDNQQQLQPEWQAHAEQMAALDHWSLEGRVGARTANEGTSFNVIWEQQDARFRIQLSGPFGQNAAQVEGRPGYVLLETSDGRFAAESLDALLAETTEIDLPLNLLRYWVRGIPAPDIPASYRLNEQARLFELSQSGWLVVYDAYHEDRSLPQRFSIERNQQSARIVIHEWQTGTRTSRR